MALTTTESINWQFRRFLRAMRRIRFKLLLLISLIGASAYIIRKGVNYDSGTSVGGYIQKWGAPNFTADSYNRTSDRLQGLRFFGVKVSVQTSELRPPRLLVYSDKDFVAKWIGMLERMEPMNGERSLHYSRRSVFGKEYLKIVSVMETGVVDQVDTIPYDWFTLYETSKQ